MANLQATTITGGVFEKSGTSTTAESSLTVPRMGTDASWYADNANAAVMTASTYTTAGKTVFAYYEGGLPGTTYGVKPRAIVATVTGDSIVYGTAGQNVAAYSVVADSNNDAEDGISIGYEQTEDKILLCYGTNGNHQHTMVVGTVVGTTTTWGTATDFDSGSTPEDDSLRHNSMVWIGGMGGDTTNRLVLAYQDDDRDGAVRVMTISGTTPTAHAVAEFATGDPPTDHCVAYIGAGKFIVAYNRLGNGEAAVGTVTGGSTNTISMAAYFRFDVHDNDSVAAQADKMAIANDGTANKVVIAFVDGASSAQRGYVRVGTWNGSVIAQGTEQIFDGAAGTDAVSLVYHAEANKMLLFYRPGGSNDIVSRTITISGTNITLGSVTALPNSDSSTNLDHSCANYDPLNKRALVFRNKGNEYGAWGIAVNLLESTLTVDLALGNFQAVNLETHTSDIRTITITNLNAAAPKTCTFTLRITQGSVPRNFIWSVMNEQTLSCTTQQYYGWMKPVPPLTTSTLSVGMTVTSGGGAPFPSGATITSIPNSETASGPTGATATGTFNLTFRPASFPLIKWAGGTGPTLTQTENAVDVYSFTTYDNGATWYGEIVGQDIK